MKDSTQKHIAIFASGRGSNAQAIIDYFKNNRSIKVALIVTNNKTAGVIQIAKDNRIPFDIISPTELKEEETLIDLLELYQSDRFDCAGWLSIVDTCLPRQSIS